MKQFGDFLILFLDCVWGRHRGRAVSSGVLFFASCLKRPPPAFLYFGKPKRIEPKLWTHGNQSYCTNTFIMMHSHANIRLNDIRKQGKRILRINAETRPDQTRDQKQTDRYGIYTVLISY